MKTIVDQPSANRSGGQGLSFVSGILLVIAVALVLVILGGTVYAFFIRAPDTSASTVSEKTPGASASGGTAVFTGLGRLRVAANKGESAAALLSITFPYPATDRPFTEELVGKVPAFRSITVGYFAALSAEDLWNLDEAAAKAELLRRFNAELLLGKIEVLYFNDLMILD
ncbi:hypothetical protein FACS1894163_11840 [Spirochaetia bacterium]|nr:hypothetical protein FACS1894163_11840 [Spirochaetia bacterium]